MVKIDSDLFSRDIDLVKDELNKRSWLPFITKSMVLHLFTNLTNRWLDTYRKQRHENSEKVLHRMKELEKLYEEREQQREEELRNTLYTLKKVLCQVQARLSVREYARSVQIGTMAMFAHATDIVVT